MGRHKNKKTKHPSPPPVESKKIKKEDSVESDSRVSTSNASTLGSSHANITSSSGTSDSEEEDKEDVSLRSRTFDLREFSGMEPEPARSSSPSVADTIIARGVEYAPPVGRYLQPAGKPNPPQILNPPVNNNSSVLQPEEFLNVDPRQLMESHYPSNSVYRSPNRVVTPTQQHHPHDHQPHPPHSDHTNPPFQRYASDHPQPNHNHHHHHHHPAPHLPQPGEFSSVRQPINGSYEYNKSTSLDVFEPYRQGQHNMSRQSLQSIRNGLNDPYHFDYQNHQTFVQQNNHHHNHHTDGHRDQYNDSNPKRKKHKHPRPKEPKLGIGEFLSGSLLGDAPLIRSFLDQRQRKYWWSPVILMETFFRSVGAVIFASNPLSGAVIYVAMLSVIPLPTLVGSLTLLVSIITAVFLVQMRLNSVRSGGITFNGFLLGIVIGQFADLSCPLTYFVVISSGLIIIYLHCAFEGLLKPLQLPLLNSPFNLAAFIFFTSGIADILKAQQDDRTFHGVDFRNYGNATENITTIKAAASEISALLNFQVILEGALFGTAQIFGTKTGVASFVVLAGVFLFSPILCGQALAGAFIGSLIGAGLDESPLSNVPTGVWAYNSLLTSAALGGFFIVLSIQSWILSVIGSILSTLVFGAMLKGDMPVLGIPFMATTWLLVACTNINSSLTTGLPNGARGTKKWMAMVRVSEHLIHTPEIHLQQFWKREPRGRKVLPDGGDRYGRNPGVEKELHL